MTERLLFSEKIRFKMILPSFFIYTSYSVFKSSISDILGLHTLRHGTGILNYLSIIKNGAKPIMGGVAHGESTLVGYTDDHTKNKFFVWNDAFHKKGLVGHPSYFVRWLINAKSLHPIVKRLGAKYYCILGGVSALTYKNVPKITQLFFQTIGGAIGIFTPVLDFHMTPLEFEKRFQVDEYMVPAARYTHTNLPSKQFIGLSGILHQGLNKQLPSRISQNPEKLFKGLLKLLFITSFTAYLSPIIFSTSAFSISTYIVSCIALSIINSI